MAFDKAGSIMAESNDLIQKEFPEIISYIGEFQVDLQDSSRLEVTSERTLSRSSKLNSKPKTPSITVFKKKDLRKFQGDLTSNIYEHNLGNTKTSLTDPGKSQVSCVRCRKLKKKCSRMLPECSNCVSSDQLCIYSFRKQKSKPGSVPKIRKVESKSPRLPHNWPPTSSMSPDKRLSLPIERNYNPGILLSPRSITAPVEYMYTPNPETPTSDTGLSEHSISPGISPITLNNHDNRKVNLSYYYESSKFRRQGHDFNIILN